MRRTPLLLALLSILVSPGAPAATPECDCGGRLADVRSSADIDAHKGARVVVHGVLRYTPSTKKSGGKPWPATSLALTDGSGIIVTYGAPPPQWDRFVDKPICVRARVVEGSPLHPQSVGGPHLSEWDFPVAEGAPKTKETPKVDELVGKRVTIEGTARDAKGGAVLLTTDGEPVYIGGLDSWPEELFGKPVVVSGRLVRRQYLPEATVDESGAWSQGTTGGQQLVLEEAAWKLAPPAR